MRPDGLLDRLGVEDLVLAELVQDLFDGCAQRLGRTCHSPPPPQNPPLPGLGHPHVPVAYVLVPPGATAKALHTEFARYPHIPTTRMTRPIPPTRSATPTTRPASA
jgi:hypothetical protein